jgi:hypothetical protein
MKKLLLIIAFATCFFSCEESRSIEDSKIENNLCHFNNGFVVEISSRGSDSNYLSCMVDGVAEQTRISNTLYKYVWETYSPGDTITCEKSLRPIKIERTNRIPIME